ncbi:hypothetical protein [Paraburkholderia sp. BCC1876]|uniref:hypothetical protein n=1 Tax=Paraburkholderia sp. BCC1876 TaxID=2676303 RepID=UPI0015908660|nr:hypothetical protein [Paraburkholderia sp. BCC1876]
MTIHALTAWLKDSISGIILLGAIGSLLAVVIGHILKPMVIKLLPTPIKSHRQRVTKQAYMLGYSAAAIQHDETGRNLVAFFSFHISKLVIYIGLILASIIIFFAAISIQSEIALTATTFSAAVCAFLGLYWAYLEYEYINRTYLFFWRTPLERAEDTFAKRSVSGNDPKAEA